MSYHSDIVDLTMMCSDSVNALKMLICSEKRHVFRANGVYSKNVVIDRWPTI